MRERARTHGSSVPARGRSERRIPSQPASHWQLDSQLRSPSRSVTPSQSLRQIAPPACQASKAILSSPCTLSIQFNSPRYCIQFGKGSFELCYPSGQSNSISPVTVHSLGKKDHLNCVIQAVKVGCFVRSHPHTAVTGVVQIAARRARDSDDSAGPLNRVLVAGAAGYPRQCTSHRALLSRVPTTLASGLH